MTQDILLIDDSPDFHMLVEAGLRLLDVTLRHAYDGEAGTRAALEQPPDLVLLDLEMSTISGLEVCRLLRADPCTKTTPIVFLTGMSAREWAVQGLVLGPDAYIAKPFKLDEFRMRVQCFLEARAKRDRQQARTAIDTLTGLRPRGGFQLLLEEMALQETLWPVGMTLLGIDSFRNVNEKRGHVAADTILALGARHLADSAGSDPVFRLGGARFVVLHPGGRVDELPNRADDLRASLSRCLRGAVGDRVDGLGASAGVAVSERGGASPYSLLERAEVALAMAKSQGGDHLHVEVGGERQPSKGSAAREPGRCDVP